MLLENLGSVQESRTIRNRMLRGIYATATIDPRLEDGGNLIIEELGSYGRLCIALSNPAISIEGRYGEGFLQVHAGRVTHSFIGKELNYVYWDLEHKIYEDYTDLTAIVPDNLRALSERAQGLVKLMQQVELSRELSFQK